MVSDVIRVSSADNVAIVIKPDGLFEGEIFFGSLKAAEPIPFGQKVALQNISINDPVVRYNTVIGYANQSVSKGTWLKNDYIKTPPSPEFFRIDFSKSTDEEVEKLDGYTFEGYRNSDGTVGTKNVLGITMSVQCVSGVIEHVVSRIKKDLLPKYPNVDDVVGLNHHYGCGVAIDVPAAVIPKRTIRNLAQHPNLGNEVLVLGLGCEKLRPELLIDGDNYSLVYLQDPRFEGFQAMVDGIISKATVHLERLNRRRRVTCPASDLVVGMQCGGSDIFSGLSGNPVAGFAADLIVRAGGTVFFSEVTEVMDAATQLVERCANETVAKKLLEEFQWYQNYLEAGGGDRSDNPTPGNKRGGIANVVEKAMGSIAKSGTQPIVDVISPGDKVQMKGLNFVATPASDFVCGTLQLAAGMNMHVFITGRGTPYGLSMVPVVKVSSNSELGKRWFDLIDLDAGQLLTGQKTIEELGWELFQLILEAASGRKLVAADKLGLRNDLVLFNPGPIT